MIKQITKKKLLVGTTFLQSTPSANDRTPSFEGKIEGCPTDYNPNKAVSASKDNIVWNTEGFLRFTQRLTQITGFH